RAAGQGLVFDGLQMDEWRTRQFGLSARLQCADRPIKRATMSPSITPAGPEANIETSKVACSSSHEHRKHGASGVRRGIPLAVMNAIEHGSCLTLPDRDGFCALTEATPCPLCGTMKTIFILRQVMPSAEWFCACWACTEPR